MTLVFGDVPVRYVTPLRQDAAIAGLAATVDWELAQSDRTPSAERRLRGHSTRYEVRLREAVSVHMFMNPLDQRPVFVGRFRTEDGTTALEGTFRMRNAVKVQAIAFASISLAIGVIGGFSGTVTLLPVFGVLIAALNCVLVRPSSATIAPIDETIRRALQVAPEERSSCAAPP